MTNPIKGEISFETVDGETYALVYSYDALVQVEEKLDKGLVELMIALQRGRLGVLRALFWAGLQAKHPEISEKAAGELVLRLDGGVSTLGELIGEALAFAFPDAKTADDGDAAKSPPAAAAG